MVNNGKRLWAALTMVFDAARGRVEDLDDDDLEADSDENP